MLDLVKLPVPASLQFRGNQAIAWVDFVVLVERTLGVEFKLLQPSL